MTTTDEQAIEATVLDYFDRGARLATLAAWLVLLATASDSMEMPGVAVAVLVVAGGMGLVWVAAIALVVGAEKLLPFGRLVALAGGVGLIAAGIVVAL